MDGRAVDPQLVGDGLTFEAASVPVLQKGAVAAGYAPWPNPLATAPAPCFRSPGVQIGQRDECPALRPHSLPYRSAAPTPRGPLGRGLLAPGAAYPPLRHPGLQSRS
jgi:hypothetical protein